MPSRGAHTTPTSPAAGTSPATGRHSVMTCTADGDSHKVCWIVCMVRDCCDVQTKRRRMFLFNFELCCESDTHRRNLGGGGRCNGEAHVSALLLRPKIFFFASDLKSWGRDSSVGRARRSGDRIPVGARFSAPVQTGPGALPASYTMGTGSLSRG
jgi:hypothetical protein